MEKQTKEKTVKRNNVSVIYLVGGKYDTKTFEKSLRSTSWANEVIKINTNGLKGSFADFRNIGATRAKNKWLFYVDTDEVITPELEKVIYKVTNSDTFSAYAVPRRNFVFGGELKHCGLYPDYVLRLINKKSLIAWKGELHEQPEIDGTTSHLSEPMLHFKHDNLSDMVEKTNNWSEIEAKLLFNSNHPKMNIFRFASAGLREFWLRMIIQTAFMDGAKGIIYAVYQVFSRLVSYSKLWELQLKSNT